MKYTLTVNPDVDNGFTRTNTYIIEAPDHGFRPWLDGGVWLGVLLRKLGYNLLDIKEILAEHNYYIRNVNDVDAYMNEQECMDERSEFGKTVVKDLQERIEADEYTGTYQNLCDECRAFELDPMGEVLEPIGWTYCDYCGKLLNENSDVWLRSDWVFDQSDPLDRLLRAGIDHYEAGTETTLSKLCWGCVRQVEREGQEELAKKGEPIMLVVEGRQETEVGVAGTLSEISAQCGGLERLKITYLDPTDDTHRTRAVEELEKKLPF